MGVELDHIFGSRWLIDELYKLGFCVSYRGITKLKQEVLANQNINDRTKDISSHEIFVQWVADNVDHNLRNIDGKGIFHGMGIITISSSTTEIPPAALPKISRSANMKSSKEVVTDKGFQIS